MKRLWSVQWHITTNCDQCCRHCYIFNSPISRIEINGQRKIGWQELKKIADDIKRTANIFNARCRVSLTGGDPLLHSNFWQLLEYLRRRKIEVNILGNPWHLTEQVVKKLKEFKIRLYQLSLDGMEEIHDSLRKKGSFKKTIEAIKLLKYSRVPVAIMTTVSKINVSEVSKIIKLVADELKVDIYAFARYVPQKPDKDSLLTPQEYRQFLSKTWEEYLKRVNGYTQFALKDHLWKLFLWEEGLFKPIETNGVVVSGCGMGINHLTILADGQVFACRRFYSPLGKVPEEKLLDLFLSSKLDAYRDLEKMEKCKDCFLKYYCRGCPAVAYSQYEKWSAPDPQCWRKI